MDLDAVENYAALDAIFGLAAGASLIEQNGFRINSLETMYLPGIKALSYNYWGTAEVRRAGDVSPLAE